MMTGSRNILIAAIVLGFIILISYFSWTGSSPAPTQNSPGQASGESVSVTDATMLTEIHQQSLQGNSLSGQNSNVIDPKDLRSFRVSEEAKREFLEASHAQARFPSDLTFVPIDLDMEQAIGIYGRNQLYEFSVLAGRLNPSEQEIIEYLTSKNTGVPLLDRHGLTTLSPKATTVPPIKGNGMQEAKYWTGRTKDGKEFRVGLMPREDGAGSYLMMISGESKVIEDSDDLFDDLYEGFKALPQK